MKKIFSTLVGLVSVATLVHAQGGLISIENLAADVQTSSTYYNTGLSYTTAAGLAPTSGTSAYYYAVLAATSTSPSDFGNPAAPDWAALSPVTIDGGGVALGYSFGSIGGVEGPNNATGFSSSLTAGFTYDIMVVGWSSNLGTTWSAVSADFADGFSSATSPGYAGYSNIGTIVPTSAPAAAGNVFGGSGVQDGQMILFSLLPEPTTLSLAGVAGLSLLFLRRRKD